MDIEQLLAEVGDGCDSVVALFSEHLPKLRALQEQLEIARKEVDAKIVAIAHVIAVLDGKTILPPIIGNRKSTTDRQAAMDGVFHLISSEPGRRWSASELQVAAGERKIRLIVQEWNVENPDRQISIEGAKKNRRYFVDNTR